MTYSARNPKRGLYVVPQSPTGVPEFQRTILFDASFTQGGSRSATVTSQPVELSDEDINDHVILQPPSFATNTLFTDTPVEFYSVGPSGDPAFTFGAAGVNRAIKLFEKFKSDIYQKKQLVLVKTTTETFSNMICTKFDWGRDAQTGQAINISLAFQNVRLVRSGLVPTVQDQDVQAQGGSGMQEVQ